MIQFIYRLLGIPPKGSYNAALALVNALTGTRHETPIIVSHAQVINNAGEVHLYLSDGSELRLVPAEY